MASKATVLGTGYIETDIPPDAHVPKNWRWDLAVSMFSTDLKAPVVYPAALIGTRGRLTATVTELVDTNEYTNRIRQYAKAYPVGTEVVLGQGKVQLRSRHIRTGRHLTDTWNGKPERPGYDAFGFEDCKLNEDHMKALFDQIVELRFTRQ